MSSSRICKRRTRRRRFDSCLLIGVGAVGTGGRGGGSDRSAVTFSEGIPFDTKWSRTDCARLSESFSFSAALIASRRSELVAKQEISFSKQRHGRALRASHSDEGGLELVPGLGAVDKRQAGIHSNFGNPLSAAEPLESVSPLPLFRSVSDRK